MDWTPFLSGLVALGAALGGVGLGHWLSAQEREEDRRSARLQAWNERSALALGKLYDLLESADPGRMLFGVQPGNTEAAAARIERAGNKWEAAREALAVVAAGHPDGAVRDQADEILAAIPKALEQNLFLLTQRVQGKGPAKPDVLAAASRFDARQAEMRRLRELLHAAKT